MFFGPRASNLGPIRIKLKMAEYKPKNLSFGKNQKSLPSLGPDISKEQSDGRTDRRKHQSISVTTPGGLR